MSLKTPSFIAVRRAVLLIFGLALAGWEIVFRYGEDEAVLVFLAMCLGFQPARNLDVLLRKNLPPQTPVADLDPPPQKPVTDRSEETVP